MKKARMAASVVAMAVLALSLLAFTACSQPKQETSRDTDEVMEASEASFEVATEPFYVLLVGNDSRTGTTEISKPDYADGTGRSDTIMLARVDAGNHQITLVTIPRDTEDSLDGKPVKINERYRWGGIDALMSTVTDLTGVKPRYYMETTFVGFEDLVNKLGGIRMYVPYPQAMKDIVSGDEISYPAGERDLNGAEALVFARERKKYNDLNPVGGEPLRQSNDRMIVQVIIAKVLSNPETAPDVARALFSFVGSNWNVDEFVKYVKDFADHADEITFFSGTGPYEGYTNDTAGWMAYRDTEKWAKIMETVEAGGDPNSVIPAPTLYE